MGNCKTSSYVPRSLWPWTGSAVDLGAPVRKTQNVRFRTCNPKRAAPLPKSRPHPNTYMHLLSSGKCICVVWRFTLRKYVRLSIQKLWATAGCTLGNAFGNCLCPSYRAMGCYWMHFSGPWKCICDFSVSELWATAGRFSLTLGNAFGNCLCPSYRAMWKCIWDVSVFYGLLLFMHEEVPKTHLSSKTWEHTARNVSFKKARFEHT